VSGTTISWRWTSARSEFNPRQAKKKAAFRPPFVDGRVRPGHDCVGVILGV
jgi:hypothetical protein